MADKKKKELNLEELCAKWQKRLRLTDWKVKMRECDLFMQENRLGQNAINQHHKKCVISLVRENSLEADDPSVEHTLVHELLHLHFESFWNDDKTIEIEQAMNLITEALVAGG